MLNWLHNIYCELICWRNDSHISKPMHQALYEILNVQQKTCDSAPRIIQRKNYFGWLY